MNRTLCALAVALALLTPSWAWCADSAQQPVSAQASLYKRLGGFDALAAVTDDFIGRMATDPQLKRFFTGFNEGSLKRIREHVVDFLCQATGGPCAYHGQDMKTAHTGLKITEDDWNVALKHLSATFDKFKVPDRERQEVVQALTPLKADIVGQ